MTQAPWLLWTLAVGLLGCVPPVVLAVVSKLDPNTLEFGYGCGGSCQTHYRWLMQQYESRRSNSSVIEFWNMRIADPDFPKIMFEMGTFPDVMAILPAQVRQKPLLELNAFANLSKTFEKTPFSEFPQNYKNICSFKNSTTNDTMHFCIPINIFAQKVFYRPSVLAYNNVSIPVNFESLLDVCQKFASRGKSLFFFGLKLPMIFPVQYYFGALFTRLWGSELYEKLLSGNWPWVSHEVSTVMDHWKMMIDNKCFGNGTFQNSYDHTYTDQWWGASVENATFAMAVMPSWYNYYRRDGPEPLINGDIPSMPFPRIRQNISRVEIMSAEAVAVGSKSKNVPAAIEMAELFTGFEAQKQGLINGGVTSSFIPGAGSLNNSDYKILSTADQVVLWFDGISGFQFAGPAYKYFRDFLLNPTTWARSAKALDDLATELYHSKTPDPSVNVDLLRSGNSSNQDETMIFTDKATVVLAPATNDAMIYYTLDGTEPIAGTSNLYQGPINLAPPRTFNPVTFQVKAISFKSGLKFLSNVTAINITIQRSPAVCNMGCVYGICVDDNVCQCSYFHRNILFSNCTEAIPQEYTIYSSVIGTAVISVNAFLMASYVGIGAIFIAHFNHKVVRTATSMAMVLIVLGCLLGSATLFFMIQKPTVFTCNARHWFASIGFGLVWGNILAKGIRIYRLFNNTSGRTIMITNSAVFTWVGGIGGVEIFLSLIYTVVNGPKPVLIERADFLEWTCQSQSASFDRTMMAAFIVYNSLLILGGVVVAFLTRNVASDYNESQVLGYTTFTFTIVTLITTPIFSVSGLSYRARFVLFAAMIFILTGIIMFLFCGSKVVSLAREFGVLAKHQQSSQYEPVTASILKERSAQRMTPKDGETKAEAMFVTRLFCLLPGLASRWIECTIICSPTQDLLVVSNHEQGSNVLSAKMSNCIVTNVQSRITSSGGTIWTAYLQSLGKQSLKVQASDEEVLKTLVIVPSSSSALSGSMGRSSGGQLTSERWESTVKLGKLTEGAGKDAMISIRDGPISP